MKKILFILALLGSYFLTAQTHSNNIEKLKSLIDNNAPRSIIKKEFTSVLKRDSLNIEALFIFGKYGSEQRSWIGWNNGIKYLTKAIKLDPNKPKYYWFRSKAYANHYFNNHELDSAVAYSTKDLNKMIILGAKSAKIYNRKAILYEKLAKYYARKYEYFKPKVSEGWNDDGSQESEKKSLFNKAIKNYKLAELNYQKALEITPNDAEIKSSLKYLLIDIEKLKQL